MSTYNIQFHEERKFPKMCFIELSEEFRRDKKRVRIGHDTFVNDPSVFELLRFNCNIIRT